MYFIDLATLYRRNHHAGGAEAETFNDGFSAMHYLNGEMDALHWGSSDAQDVWNGICGARDEGALPTRARFQQ